MVWTAPDIKPIDEPFIADEQTMLAAFLDVHRDYLLQKCAGLTGEQLARQSVPPSNLSLLGLIRHMAEVERAWFRRRVQGSDLPWLYVRDDNEDADFTDVDPDQAEADYATLLRERDLATEVVANASLDDTFVHSRRGDLSLRWLYHHMICEYAQHNGHADLIREAIDGVKS
ncbi:MAG TPA: DinB family protein [Pseudonocardiaceae bacterium]|nr:DinB family protein [Pseudonocardiaceae bacterium]